MLDVALSRHLHAGIWAATFDGGEENRIALDAEGRASAVRDLYADGGGSGRGGARSGLWRIEAVDGEPTECAVTVVLGRYSLQAVAAVNSTTLRGTVLEGEVDGDFVGRFEMALASLAHAYVYGHQEWEPGWLPRQEHVYFSDNVAIGDFISDFKDVATGGHYDDP